MEGLPINTDNNLICLETLNAFEFALPENLDIQGKRYIDTALKSNPCDKQRGIYKNYSNECKIRFLHKAKKVGSKHAASIMKIPLSTARSWLKKDEVLRQTNSSLSDLLRGIIYYKYSSRRSKEGWSRKKGNI